MGQTQRGILDVRGGKDRLQGVQTHFCNVVLGVSLSAPPLTLLVCSETNEVILLIHVSVWLNRTVTVAHQKVCSHYL